MSKRPVTRALVGARSGVAARWNARLRRAPPRRRSSASPRRNGAQGQVRRRDGAQAPSPKLRGRRRVVGDGSAPLPLGRRHIRHRSSSAGLAWASDSGTGARHDGARRAVTSRGPRGLEKFAPFRQLKNSRKSGFVGHSVLWSSTAEEEDFFQASKHDPQPSSRHPGPAGQKKQARSSRLAPASRPRRRARDRRT
jgi:hypothetical protein